MMLIGFKMNLQIYLLLRMKEQLSLCVEDNQGLSVLAPREILCLTIIFRFREIPVVSNQGHSITKLNHMDIKRSHITKEFHSLNPGRSLEPKLDCSLWKVMLGLQITSNRASAIDHLNSVLLAYLDAPLFRAKLV